MLGVQHSKRARPFGMRGASSYRLGVRDQSQTIVRNAKMSMDFLDHDGSLGGDRITGLKALRDE